MIMSTFTVALDFTGKTVFPLVTRAVSGLGRAPAGYEQACRGAPLGEGLAIRGEEADAALPEVRDWLTRVHLLNEN